MATVGPQTQKAANVPERFEGVIRQSVEAVVAGMAADTILAFGAGALWQSLSRAHTNAAAPGQSLALTTDGLVIGGPGGPAQRKPFQQGPAASRPGRTNELLCLTTLICRQRDVWA